MFSQPIANDAAESRSFLQDDVEVFSRRGVLGELGRRPDPTGDLGAPPVLKPGARVGRFRLSAQLGEGASGVVYAAYDERRRREVAVKVVRETDDPTHRQRFLREGRLGAAVKHPNLAQVLELVDTPGCSLIVMELLRGRTLCARMRETAAAGGLPREEALRIARRLCRGLAALHDAGILHRDIKPSNVMIAEDSGVKLIDFGLASRSRTADLAVRGIAGRPGDDLTERGMVTGTPRYMSPEQGRGELLDARTDVFSMGVLLYEMLAGTRPFAGRTTIEVLLAVQRDDPEPPSRRGRRADPIAPMLDRVVLRCLEKDRRARYADAGKLLRDLLALSRTAELAQAA